MTPEAARALAAAPPLGEDEVHVWHVGLDRGSEEARALRRLLSSDERARAARFHFARDRSRFEGARGLLRLLLGHHLGLAPERIAFAYGPRGKPGLPAGGSAGLAFNVSHSAGRALIAVTRGRQLGIDLERERSVPEMDAIAESHFSCRERAELRALAPSERPAAFFRCWTRKEAFVKATGDGLLRPLDAFSVTLGPGEPARLLEVGEAPDEASRWWLEELGVPAGFWAALAVEGRPSRVVCRHWPESEEGSDGAERERGHDDLQGGREPRGAVLDLAGGGGEPARLAGRGEGGAEGRVSRLDQGGVDRHASAQPATAHGGGRPELSA